MIEGPAWLLKLNSTPVITCYHPVILIVSFCVLSSLKIKHENIIINNYALVQFSERQLFW